MAASIGKYTNGDIVSGAYINLDSNITVSFGKGTANTEPALYSGAIRIYQNGGTLTVNALNGKQLDSIVITTDGGKDGNGYLLVDGGTCTQNGDILTIKVNENADSVVVIVGGSSKNDRLYVASLEVIYLDVDGNEETPDGGNGGTGNDGNGEESYTYTDFTEEENSTYNSYVGFVIPFLPNNDYTIEAYEESGYKGVYYSALCESEADFTAYLELYSDYSNDGTDTDEYGDTWYLYSKDGIYVDVCYYEYEGAYYVDVDAYYETETDDGNGGADDGGNGEESYSYTDFTEDEKSIYNEYIGFVIPFLPNNDYAAEAYEESGYKGVYYSALCESEADFTAYLELYSDYSNDGTDTDEYGDTWYLYSKDGIYVDVCYYEYEGAYYVDVDAYYETDTESGGDNGENPGTGDSGTEDVELITNSGLGLPDDDGDGVHDVDFTAATNVKDVTDQGYYLDGCPTTGAPGVLVIPVEFSDVTAASKGYSIDKIKEAFIKDGATDYYSVYDYYYTSSYGQLDLNITVLDSWFRPANSSTYYMNQTMDYYGSETAIGDQMIIDEVLQYLDPTMDLSQFDSDSNGTIDAVVLVTTLDIDADEVFYWAYRYWNIYTDNDGYYYEYDGVSANDYLWAPYQFLYETYDENGNVSYTDTDAMNTYTFIHEFGHVLGADDYYDTAYVGTPMGGFDIMDSMQGDHNAYSKFNYGWITSSRLVVTDSSVTLTLEDFSKNGDTVILANNWSDELGAYQEYYVVVYYTNNGLNADGNGYFTRDGIVVYHVNASLYEEDYDGETYYDVYNNNTDPSDSYGTEDNLLEFVLSEDGNYTYVIGDTLGSVTDSEGNSLLYTFSVDELNGNSATLTFTKNS